MTKTPEEMAEEYAENWHKNCDYPAEILRNTKKATETVFLAGYKAGQEHPFQFQTKMWVDPIGPQDRWISVKERLPEEGVGWTMVYGCILSRWSANIKSNCIPTTMDSNKYIPS